MKTVGRSERRRRRSSTVTINEEFSNVVSLAVERLEREHGYSRERATRALLQEIVVIATEDSSPRQEVDEEQVSSFQEARQWRA